MQTGTVIVINGASSAGKTTLVRALQAALPDPYLDAGLDKFLWMLPGRWLQPPRWNDVMGQATRAGPVGHTLVQRMHRAVAELARAGNHVLVDHVMVEEAWLQHAQSTLAGLPTLFVAAYCPLPVLQERERARGDRTLGQAEAQAGLVHRHARYDVVVDTSVMSAEEGAHAVHQHLVQSGPNLAFNSGARCVA